MMPRNSKTLVNNFGAARRHAKMTQVKASEITGIPVGTLRRWEQGQNEPDMESVIRLAELYGTTTDTLLGTRFSEQIPGSIKVVEMSEFIDVPIYGSIAAGTPIDMMEIDDSYPLHRKMHDRYPNGFMLRTEGNSMNRLIPNGYLALIDPDEREPNDKDVFAVCVNGYTATLKHVKRLANGFELIPDSYDPTYISTVYDYNKNETEEITIIGKAVWATMPFDYKI
jgi:repressor LexA